MKQLVVISGKGGTGKTSLVASFASLAERAVLADCALVYVGEIGGPAAARLVAKKIHPIKSKEREPITVVVEKLQEVLRGTPPPWLRKAMLKSERPSI